MSDYIFRPKTIIAVLIFIIVTCGAIYMYFATHNVKTSVAVAKNETVSKITHMVETSAKKTDLLVGQWVNVFWKQQF